MLKSLLNLILKQYLIIVSIIFFSGSIFPNNISQKNWKNKDSIINFKGQIITSINDKQLTNVKVTFVTIKNTYVSITNEEGLFELKIPKSLISNENIVKIEFDDIPDKKYNNITEIENDTCKPCFYDTQVIIVEKNELSNFFYYKAIPHVELFGVLDYVVVGVENHIPLVYFHGEKISYNQYEKNIELNKFKEVNWFRPEYTKALCNEYNKSGIYICF